MIIVVLVVKNHLLLQGALDGGLDIPHSDKRFAGLKKDEKRLDPEVHRKYIYGGHVAEYMKVSWSHCSTDSAMLTPFSFHAVHTILYTKQWVRFGVALLIRVLIFGTILFQTLADDEPEKYQSHFSEYIKRGLNAEDMEAIYKKVHAAIRADPTPAKSTKEAPKTHKR